MTQAELNWAVAEVTGESVRTIADYGFVPLTRGPVEREYRVRGGEENRHTRRVQMHRRRRVRNTARW